MINKRRFLLNLTFITLLITVLLLCCSEYSLASSGGGESAEPAEKPTPAKLMDQAIQLSNKGDYKEAIKIYKEILVLEPKNGMAFFGLGVSYEHLEKYEKAEECFISYKERSSSDEWKIVDELLQQMKSSIRSN